MLLLFFGSEFPDSNSDISFLLKSLKLRFNSSARFSFSSINSKHQGLGLGTFIGKTLLEKNFATVKFNNSEFTGGAEVTIEWKDKDLKKI